MALLSNITLSFILMFILVVAGYLISAFFDLEIQYYMPYLLWFLALCIFNMFLDKSHVNIYDKKSVSDDGRQKIPETPRTETFWKEPYV
jgi:hypothetical protein